MAGLQGGNDAFGAAQVVEGVQRLLVGDAHVLGPAQFLQPGVLGADAGVVEAGADAVRLGDLAVLVLQDEDRKSTRLNSSHSQISYAVFCLKKKKKEINVIAFNH